MKQTIPTYFAAANSYRGFISYFDRVFDSKEYDRIFVLKGGPGTGKSSLMRKISEHFRTNDFYVEEILCSSDPASLDGVIGIKNGRKFAVLDGTAPHERDAIYPGIIDEIINLGDGWDERWLIGKKTEILSLAKEKKKAYETAYNYLNIAGKCDDIIALTISDKFDIFKAKSKAESILSDLIAKENGEIKTRLLSSFGRHGKYNIEPCESIFDARITVSKDGYLFLKTCADMLKSNSVDITLFPSPLSPEKLNALLLNNTKLLIQISDNAEIKTEEFVTLSPLDNERIRVAREMHDEILLEAARWFKIAAEIHASLEDIYSSAMDFSKNDEHFAKIIAKISFISENGQ